MARKYEQPKEQGAPLYMVQYAALMSLLLAFFVTLQSMGQKKTHRFKKGVGDIQNAFGLKGGFGLLPYWKVYRGLMGGSYPDVSKDAAPDGDLLGFVKGMLWRSGVEESAPVWIEMDPAGARVAIGTPLEFAPGRAALLPASREVLDRFGSALYDLDGFSISVSCVVDGGAPESERAALAVERAATVARYIDDRFGDGAGPIRAVGYAHWLHAPFQGKGVETSFLLRRKDLRPAR